MEIIDRLVPRIVTDDNIKTNIHIDSFIAEGFAAFNFENNILRLKLITLKMVMTSFLLVGLVFVLENPLTDRETYANTSAISKAGSMPFSFYVTKTWR